MRKSLFFALSGAILAVSACNSASAPLSGGTIPAPPTPLEQAMAAITPARVDQLVAGVDLAATTLNLLIETKRITPGSPLALQAADRLENARDAANGARQLLAVGRFADAARRFELGEDALKVVNDALAARAQK